MSEGVIHGVMSVHVLLCITDLHWFDLPIQSWFYSRSNPSEQLDSKSLNLRRKRERDEIGMHTLYYVPQHGQFYQCVQILMVEPSREPWG